MSEEQTTWRAIPSHPKYKVTQTGRVRNAASKRELKPMENGSGHLLFFVARGKKCYVHRAVIETFNRKPRTGELVRHLDGNPKNNHISNLRFGTVLDNMRDKRRHGRQTKRESHPPAKLTESDVMEIKKLIGKVSLREIGRRYGVTHTTIRRAANGMKWKHLRGASDQD